MPRTHWCAAIIANRLQRKSDGRPAPPDAAGRLRLWLLLGLAGASIAVWAAGEAATLWLRYERLQVLDGELWRLLTAHLVHLDGRHLALNLTGLVLIAALFPSDYSGAEWTWVGLGSAAAIAFGFLVLEPELEWYVGLSGVLHGLLAAGAISWWRRQPPLMAIALTAGLVGKLIYESVAPGSLASGWPVVVSAHLYGAIGGAVVALMLQAGSAVTGEHSV